MRNISDKICRANQNTHLMFNNSFSFKKKSCRLWGNVEKYSTAVEVTEDNRIRRMCISRWVHKATNTYSQYVTLTAFPLLQWLHERASMLCYTYIACFVAGLLYRVAHEKPTRRLVDQRGRRSRTLYRKLNKRKMQSTYWLEKVLKMISL